MFKRSQILILLILIILTMGLFQCSVESQQEKISRVLDINVEEAEIVFQVDTHGGFHNDGILFVQLALANSDIESNLKLNTSWNVLPLNDSIYELIYGSLDVNKKILPVVSDDKYNPYFSNVDNGYYFFIDKSTDKTFRNFIIVTRRIPSHIRVRQSQKDFRKVLFMNTVRKVVVFILAGSLFGAIFCMVYLGNKSNEFQNEITMLNEQLNDKDREIMGLQNQVKAIKGEKIEQEEAKQKEQENLNDEIKRLNDANISLKKEVDEFKELIKEYEDTLGRENFDLEQLRFELSSKLVYNNILIDLNLSENRAIELFGPPVEENIEKIGSDGIWYLEGKYSKESIYNKFTLYYYGDQNGSNYELVKVTTDNSNLYLTNEMCVGDSLEDLLIAYPMLVEDTWSNVGVRYLYPDGFGLRGVFFEIENDRISKITLSRLFD